MSHSCTYVLYRFAVKTYREILTSDIIHIRRPDGQTLDSFMHANAALLAATPGFALVFNPTTAAINASMAFPLYYTGE